MLHSLKYATASACLLLASVAGLPAAQAAPAPSSTTTGVHAASSSTLTHAQAATRLRQAGITWTTSGHCDDRRRSNCTSFSGIRVRTIQGISALKRNSRCPITITGGTERGHASGTYSHGNGYKLDIKLDRCVNNWIKAHSRRSHDRGDAVVYTGTVRGVRAAYALERNHWDITFR
ncbi:hypothetical protein [Streptomyces sp. NPDC047973]|uniref:hypothetical protein n=1 Tax=Streptomyces sp. NPDC047973 TaxID=3155383 RepID=UPI0034496F7D